MSSTLWAKHKWKRSHTRSYMDLRFCIKRSTFIGTWSQETLSSAGKESSSYAISGLLWNVPKGSSINWKALPDGTKPQKCFMDAGTTSTKLMSGVLDAFWCKSQRDNHTLMGKVKLSSCHWSQGNWETRLRKTGHH